MNHDKFAYDGFRGSDTLRSTQFPSQMQPDGNAYEHKLYRIEFVSGITWIEVA
jgi:hypothetical protein